MDANVKATPRAILNGIADGSGRDISSVDEKLPGHLPLLFVMSQRGPDTVEYVEGNAPSRIYGTKTFVEGSEYFTHQTNLLKRFLANSNAVMVQRIIPPNASKAMIRLSVEIIPTDIPEYVFNDDGSIKYVVDELGMSVPQISGTITGSRLIWHASINPEGKVPVEYQGYRNGQVLEDFRTGDVQAVDSTTLSTIEGATSTLYPIMDIELRDFGKFGNKVGLYISDITGEGIDALNQMSSINDFLYRIKVVELDESNLPVLQRSKQGDTYVTVSLSEDSFDPDTKYNFAITSVMGEKYELLKDTYIYQQNLKDVTEKLINGYTHNGLEVIGENTDSYNSTDYLLMHGKLNIFHGVDTQRQVYKTFSVAESYKFLGVDLSRDCILGEGGHDGLVVKVTGEHDVLANLQIFDDGVRQFLSNWASNDALLQDPAKNPFTTLWDSGFSLETKKAFSTPMALRSDIWAVISTFMVADYVGPAIEVVEPQRSWMTLMGLSYTDVELPPVEDENLIAIDPTKLQMGITGVTNGYVINGITAKNAGDDWNIIPLNALIKPQDAEALAQLAIKSPDAIVIKDNKGNPLYTASQVMTFERDEEGNFKYPVFISRSQPVGSLSLILDWDGALNNNYFTNTWSMNWNINIQEPDPVASPVTFGGIGTFVDTGYLKPEDYIESVEYISDQELNLEITNKASAGWYWKYIHLNAVISADFINTISKQAANGLESAIVTVDHNGEKTNYRAGEVITLNNDNEGNLLIPLLLNRAKVNGVISILADYDGNDAQRFYQTPLKINYNITPVNPPQKVSTIQFAGFDTNFVPVKDGEYLDYRYGRITEHAPNQGTDQLFKLTNVVDAGWYWTKVKVHALIKAEDAAAMKAAYEAGYEGVVLTIKQNGVMVRTGTAQQLEALTRDVNGNIIVPLEINRNQPTGTFVFDMDWDAGHLDYLPGKKIIEYQLTPVNPIPLKSWVTYQGIDPKTINLPTVPQPESPGPWYKDLRVSKLSMANASQELSLSNDKYTNKINTNLTSGWYWDHATVYFSIAKDAIDLIKLATTKNHVGDVLTVNTPWRNYKFTSEQVLALVDASGTAWFSIDIPRNYPSGKINAIVDWDLGTFPEATTTNIEIAYSFNIVNIPQILSVVKWGGVDNSYPNIVDAPYLRPDQYIQNVIATPTGYDITIENGSGAGWYWTEVHTNLTIAAKDVAAMQNAEYNSFTVAKMSIDYNGVITRLGVSDILALKKDAVGNYLYPITIQRNITEGSIKVTVDFDGDHKDYLENTTVFNYRLAAIDPNPLESTITYRGVRSYRESRALTINAPGIISNNYLTETFTGTPEGYTVKIVTQPEAGWYWTEVQTYLAVAPDVLVFLEKVLDKGHIGKVLTLTNGSLETSYTTEQILALERDTDGAALIPYIIPRKQPIGTILATVDWDTNMYPEARPNTIRIAYNIEINNPQQVSSQMFYKGVDILREYETTGEYVLPSLLKEVTTHSTNNYRTVITVGPEAGWYWNKVAILGQINANDLRIIEEAKAAGYAGTVLSAYQNGTNIYTLDADAILALDRDAEGNAILPFTLSSTVIDGEITAVIDWDVNHLDYTQSTWRLTYKLEITRPGMVTPKFLVEEDFNINYTDRLPVSTYKFTASESSATITLEDIFPETADKVGLKYSLDRETSEYIKTLAVIDPGLVVLNNGIDGKSYTAAQLAAQITDNPLGQLIYFVPASRLIGNGSFTMILDLDGTANNLYRPSSHVLRYSYSNKGLGVSGLIATYVEATYEPNFVRGWQSGNTINMVLSGAVTNRNKYRMEFKILNTQWAAFQKARTMGMSKDTIVLTMLLTGTNTTVTCTAEQLENMIYQDDLSHAYFIQDYDISHGDIKFNFHWTKGYAGYSAGAMTLSMNLRVLVEQRLNVVNYTFDTNYGDLIIPTKEYGVVVTNAEGGISSTARVNLDSNYPTDRSQVRLAITFPREVSDRIMTLINESPTTPVFRDNQSGQVYTAGDFTGLIKKEEYFIYPIYLSLANTSGVLSYKLTLNAIGEDLYSDYTYTVNYAISTGSTVNPSLKPVLKTMDSAYTNTKVVKSGNDYVVSMDCSDPLVPAFNIDLAIPSEYHNLILEAIAENPDEIILSSDSVVVYGRDFTSLETLPNGDKVIRDFTVTPDPDNVDLADPTIVRGEYSFTLSYTPNYSGAKALMVKHKYVFNITAMEISCVNSTTSTYAEFNGNVETEWFDVQLDGVIHRGINYARLVDLCKGSGIEIIPMGAKPVYPVIPSTEDASVEFDIDGFWIPEVNGVALTDEPVSAEQAMELLALQGITFVSTNTDTDGASE